MKFKLVWEGDIPILTETETHKLAKEISEIENAIDDASSLIFHLVQLDKDQEGPSITIYGKTDNSDELFLEYQSKTEWFIMDSPDAEHFQEE
jgi:hypothetical protein